MCRKPVPFLQIAAYLLEGGGEVAAHGVEDAAARELGEAAHLVGARLAKQNRVDGDALHRLVGLVPLRKAVNARGVGVLAVREEHDGGHVVVRAGLRRQLERVLEAYGVTRLNGVVITHTDKDHVGGLKKLLNSDEGFYVTSLSEMLATLGSMINMVVMVLTAIAAISLVVGGIGIMNIMMVSVAERTREIGIRKALGAKERSILALFVTEAATTSALGGLIGILLGYLISAGVSQIMIATKAGMTIQPSLGSVMVAFGISVGIGVLFGYLPAKRAARLNPIEALRYD